MAALISTCPLVINRCRIYARVRVLQADQEVWVGDARAAVLKLDFFVAWNNRKAGLQVCMRA